MKRFLLLLFAIVAAINIYAQPKQTIISVAVAPENTDWQYECGDDVTFSLSVNKAGIPLKDAKIYYEISEDMQSPRKKGEATIETTWIPPPKGMGLLRRTALCWHSHRWLRHRQD